MEMWKRTGDKKGTREGTYTNQGQSVDMEMSK